MVDRHDRPAQLPAGQDGLASQPGTRSAAPPDPGSGRKPAGGQLGRQRRKDVAAVEGRARPVDSQVAQDAVRRAAAGSGCDSRRSSTPASRPLSGARNSWPSASTTAMSRELPTPGSTTATCTVPGGKYPNERPSQKPASAGQCTRISCVRSTSRAAREATQHLALHHPDERVPVAEIRRQRDDAGRAGTVAMARPWAWGLPG